MTLRDLLEKLEHLESLKHDRDSHCGPGQEEQYKQYEKWIEELLDSKICEDEDDSIG